MSLVAVCSSKHSPGVTTLALALAARTNAMLVEADPAGGDLAARWGLPLDPGMLTLAAASRRGLTPELIDRHAQRTESGLRVLAAPPSAEQARSALFSLGSPFAAALVGAPTSGSSGAVADCGRWDPAGPCADLVSSAEITLLVLRPRVEDVAHARSRLASLIPTAQRTLVITIGERPYGPGEVSEALGGTPTLTIADDRTTAGQLAAGRGLDRAMRRTPFIRSIEPVLDLLADPGPAVPHLAHRKLVHA